MRNWAKFYVLCVLLIAAIVLVTSGTMAFYSSSFSLSALIRTAEFTLKVNDSTSETQTLTDMTLAPGDTLTRNVKIDTSNIETPATLTVTLAIHASGDLPPGLSVSLDGIEATGTGSLTAVKTVNSAEKQIINMTVSAAWTTSAGEDLEPYQDLDISYEVTVEADQKAGG